MWCAFTKLTWYGHTCGKHVTSPIVDMAGTKIAAGLSISRVACGTWSTPFRSLINRNVMKILSRSQQSALPQECNYILWGRNVTLSIKLLFPDLLGDPFTDLGVDALDHGAEAAATIIVPALINVIAVEPISTEEKSLFNFDCLKLSPLNLYLIWKWSQ